MRSIESVEARTHLSRLLCEVERGQTITITRRGVPVARLVPIKKGTSDLTCQVIERIKTLRKGRTLGGLNVRELINEGRR